MRKFVFTLVTALSGLFVFVITAFAQDSLNVRRLGQITRPQSDYAYDLAIDGDYAYLASWGQGVSIVNIANSNELIDEGSFYPPC